MLAGHRQRQVHRGVYGVVGDSKPRTRRDFSPLPTPVIPASAASRRRQLLGCRPDWEISRTAPAAARKSSNSTPQEALNSGPRAHPHPGLGDHAQGPLGAEQRPVGRGAGARARQPPAPPQPARRDRPHRLDQVVDVRVESREVAAGPGRDPAAQRRVLERLREVTQGQPVLAQLLLQPRPGRPGLDPRRQRLRVDLQHPVEPPQVEGHERPLPQPPLDPADHARPAAKGNDCGPLRLAPAQHRLDLGLVPRQRHQIRRIRKFPPQPPHHVPVSLPQRPRDPLVLPLREQIPKRRRRLQPRLAHLHRIERNSLLRRLPEPKPRPDPGRSLLQLFPRGRLILVPPPPVLEPPLGHRREASQARREGSAGGVPPAAASSFSPRKLSRRQPGSATGEKPSNGGTPPALPHPPPPPTSGRLSSDAQRQPPRWWAPDPAPRRPCPSPPATPGTACRPC